MAALGAVKKLASGNPGMSHLGAEMAILLEVWDVDEPEGRHLPGRLNELADWLSRTASAEKPERPAGLAGLKVRELVRRGQAGRGYVLATPTQEPALWAWHSEESETDLPHESS